MKTSATRSRYLWIFSIAILLFSFNVCSFADKENKTDEAHTADRKNKADKEKAGKDKNQRLFMFQGPGAEPWVTDGTAEGTMMIDVNSGMTSFAYGFTRFKGDFYFQAYDGVNGFELWKSDGTLAGTKLVKDINPGPGSSFHYRFTEFVAYKGALYFQANDGVHGFELWRTDGTEAGTVLVEDIHTLSPAGSSSPGRFTVMNNVLYFSAYHGLGGHKLRKFSGSTPSSLVSNNDVIAGGAAPDDVPVPFTEFEGQLYLSARDTLSSRYALWKTDGTFAGTVLVKDVIPSGFQRLNDALFFNAYDDVNGFELWKSDGTTPGTVLVKDIYPGVGSSQPRMLTPVPRKNTLYLQAFDPVYGYELWKSDGTEANTTIVKDISVENGGRFSDYHFSHFNVFKGELYFVSKDNVNRQRLWKSDGSAEGTVLFPDFGSVDNFTVMNNKLYFTAVRGSEYGLWKTNGTQEGTVLVKSFAP